jgi:hypothetical protein
VPFWKRRDETLNEQLLREAGLEAAQEEPHAPTDAPAPDFEPAPVRWQPDPVLGMPYDRPGRFPDLGAELVGSVDAPGVAGDRVQFVTLPDGSLLVEDERGDEELAPFAEAVEQKLAPPYRAVGTRQDRDSWAVGAAPIDVRELAGLPGDAISLALHGGERTLVVDDEERSDPLPQLDELAGGRDAVVAAERLEGDWWEVRVDPL